MAGTTLWRNLSYELSKADNSLFKEKVISLLKVINPYFEECSDIIGADFIVKSDDDKFICVVQCQIFDTNFDLYEAHADQILSRVQLFIDKGFKCNEYWVVHNHQHGNTKGEKFVEFLESIEKQKKILENSGNINNFLVFQRIEFLKKVQNDFKNTLARLFQNYSNRYRLEVENTLEFGKYYIHGIPAEYYELLFKEFEPFPDMKKVEYSSFKEVTNLIISDRKDVRWTLIHGEAGAGKTTTVLHAAMAKSKIVFFINCEILNFYSLLSGTNFLFEDIIRSLKLLDEEFEEEKDRELLYALSGATFPKIFEHSTEHILIFDGLDENRFYSDPQSGGLKKLSDRLSDINCPIVLVTRTSHFEESLFSQLVIIGKAGAGKARKKARAIKLVQWSKHHVIKLLNNILSDYKDNLFEVEYKRIERFKNLFVDESYINFYGDLPLNPLFLQFILSDVVERDIQKVNRPTLIYHWVRRKIYRDIEKENRPFIVDKNLSQDDLLDLVDKILYTMELTSKDMTISCDNFTFDLKDYTDSEKIEKIAAKIFQVDSVRIIDLLLNSVLSSQVILTRDKYRATRQRVTFIFRILQEYFLACFLVRNKENFSCYPKMVRYFCEEIIKTDDDEELWMYLKKEFYESKEKVMKKVFIVHGQNSHVRNEINLFLKGLGLDTVVMADGAHTGRTLPEKFEEMAKCDFAVFLMTADDKLLDMNSNKELKRARQNVVLEIGYFWGSMGRKRNVAFLKDDDVELPSDIQGLGWIPITADLGITKLRLQEELKESGVI